MYLQRQRPTYPAKRTLRRARTAALIAAAGLTAWFGVRVAAANSAKSEYEAKPGPAQPAAAPPAPAKLVRGTPAAWQATIPVEGSLAPVREADLAFRVAGRLRAVHATLGAQVAAGEPLAALDVDEARARLAASNAEVRAGEARLRIARDAQARSAPLVESGAQSPVLGVQTAAAQQLAEAQLAAAQAQRSMALALLQQCTLDAPFAGTITRVPDGEGAVVLPGVAQFHLMDLSALKLAGTIGEADAALVRPGAQIELDLGSRQLLGYVTAVVSAADPSTRRVPIEARFPNDPGAPLLPGRYSNARIHSGAPLPVLRIPGSALRPGSQDEVMLVVDGRASPRRIVFTPAQDGGLLVRGGLLPSDQILETPSADVEQGEAIP